MKKHQLLALVGTLALLVNLLVPGLAFGAQGQAGQADLGCSATVPAFTLVPGATFNFTSDGIGGALTSSVLAQDAFKDGAVALGNTTGTDYIEVEDVRDPSEAACNDGITLTLAATGAFVGATTGLNIPLQSATDNYGTYVVSSSDTCAAGSTEVGATCFGDTARCGRGDATPTAICAGADGTKPVADYTGTDFTTLATFLADVDSKLGTNATTPRTIGLLSFPDCGVGPCVAGAGELYGKAGLATSFATRIPAGQAADVYTLSLEYTLTAL